MACLQSALGGLEACRVRDPALTAEAAGGRSPWQRTVHYCNGASLPLLQSHGQPRDSLLQFLQAEVAPGRAEGGEDLSTSRVGNDTDLDRCTISWSLFFGLGLQRHKVSDTETVVIELGLTPVGTLRAAKSAGVLYRQIRDLSKRLKSEAS